MPVVARRHWALACAWACVLGPVAVSSITTIKPAIALAALAPVAGLLAWVRSHSGVALHGLAGHPLSPWCGLWLVASAVGGVIGLARGNDLTLLAGQLVPAATFAAGFLAAGPLLAKLGPLRWPLLLSGLGVILGLPGIIHEAAWVFGFVDENLIRFLDKSALVCVIAFILVVGLVLRRRPALGSAVALGLGVLVLLTFTRSYWLGAAAAVLLLLPALAAAELGPGGAGRPSRRRVLQALATIGLVAIAAAGVAVATGAPDLIAARLESRDASLLDSSRIVRVFELKAAWEQVQLHPLTGIGAGGEYPTLAQFGTDLIVYGPSNFIHNAYLYLPLKFGVTGFIAGFALLFGVLLAIARGVRTAYRTGSSWDASHAAAFAGLCAASITAPILLDPVYAGMAGAIARMAVTADSPPMTKPPLRQARTTLLVAGAAALLGGGIAIGLTLGKDGDATVAAQTPPAPLTALAAAQGASDGPFVTHPEVAAAGKATPSRLVLRYWQFVQFRATLPEIRELFAPSVSLDQPTFTSQLNDVRSLFALSKPYIIDEQRDGSVARVFTLISSDGLKRSRSGTGEPFIFRTVRTARGWRLADNAFVEAKSSAEVEARRRGQP